MIRILVVDDEAILREAIVEALRRAGHEVEGFDAGRPALDRLAAETFHLVITDLKMPGMDGLAVLEEAKRIAADVPVILITAHGTIAGAVEAMKRGAYDYVIKPFQLDELEVLVQRAMDHRGLSVENEYLRTRVGDGELNWVPIGGLQEIVDRAAASDATVLISGETGTGKEVVARMLHRQSPRRSAPFLCVNCAALSAGLHESELFGHEKGAFTGADRQRKGRFELADRGTILLDEVSEIDPNLQAKLLRVLQERCFERVGSSQTRRVDVRVIATTNRDLREEAAKGRFREDLYYRLNVIPIALKPLRERRDEIPGLVRRFLGKKRIAKDALWLLQEYRWPGNVRELKNILERAEVLAPGDEISAEIIAPWVQTISGAARTLLGRPLEEIEREAIEGTLSSCGGNREQAARILGITSRTLRDKLKRWSE